MSTNNRRRYATGTMADGDESQRMNANESSTQSQRARGPNPFPQPTSWADSIWQNPSGQVRPNRENLGSRGSSIDDGFPAPSGSSALTATSEAETWAVPWNNTDVSQTRNETGSTSPTRTRDAVNRPFSGPSSFYTPSQVQVPSQPVFGQRGATNTTSRWNSGATFDTSPRSSLNRLSQTGQYSDNSDNPHASSTFRQGTRFEPEATARGFRNEAHASHEAYGNSMASIFPGDSSRAAGSHPPSDTQAQGALFAELAYDPQAASVGHSQRGSVSAMSGSFGSTTMNMRAPVSAPNDLDSLEQNFNRGLSFDDNPAAASSNSRNMPAGNSGRRTFQFNPDSDPWDGLRAQGNNSGAYQYQSNIGGGIRNNRGGAPDRGPTPSGGYRQSRDAQRSFGATPGSDSWFPHPSFRNPAMLAETNHRGLGSHLTHHLSQIYPSHFSVPPPMYNMNGVIHLPFPPRQTFPHDWMPGMTGVPTRPNRQHDSAESQRSELLRDFRSTNKNKRYELRDIYGSVVEFCGDQHGSRFIQEKLATANSDEKDKVFGEIEPNAVQLMQDVFGNYVVQKLFEHGNQIQKRLLAKAMKGKMVRLSVDQYGCRVVQKALEHVLVEQQQELVRELEPEVLKVMKDSNGNHVIQKALGSVPRQSLDFIFNSFRGRVKELACHNCACRVLQRAIDCGTEEDKAKIIEEVHAHCRELTNDQYGNYVVQHVLETGGPEDRTRVIGSILGDVVHLSKQKYASNVVEKCAMYGTSAEVLQIEAEMTTSGPDGTSPLRVMIIDQYANYVIQKHVHHTPNKQAFLDALRPHLQWARASYTGKHLDAITKLLNETSPARRGQPTPPSTRHSSTAPASPLQLDVGSAAPTPNLTMEPNSPSSSPPSTAESAVDEPFAVTLQDPKPSAEEVSRGPEVRVEDS